MGKNTYFSIFKGQGPVSEFVPPRRWTSSGGGAVLETFCVPWAKGHEASLRLGLVDPPLVHIRTTVPVLAHAECDNRITQFRLLCGQIFFKFSVFFAENG